MTVKLSTITELRQERDFYKAALTSIGAVLQKSSVYNSDLNIINLVQKLVDNENNTKNIPNELNESNDLLTQFVSVTDDVLNILKQSSVYSEDKTVLEMVDELVCVDSYKYEMLHDEISDVLTYECELNTNVDLITNIKNVVIKSHELDAELYAIRRDLHRVHQIDNKLSIKDNVWNLITFFQNSFKRDEELLALLTYFESYNSNLSLLENLKLATNDYCKKCDIINTQLDAIDEYETFKTDSVKNRDLIKSQLEALGVYNEDISLIHNIKNLVSELADCRKYQYKFEELENKFSDLKSSHKNVFDKKTLDEYKLRLISNYIGIVSSIGTDNSGLSDMVKTINEYINHNEPLENTNDLTIVNNARKYLSTTYENFDHLSSLQVNIENLIIDYKANQGLLAVNNNTDAGWRVVSMLITYLSENYSNYDFHIPLQENIENILIDYNLEREFKTKLKGLLND